jgi:hypothetical protein
MRYLSSYLDFTKTKNELNTCNENIEIEKNDCNLNNQNRESKSCSLFIGDDRVIDPILAKKSFFSIKVAE